jgi:glutathione S-transferase
LSGKSSSAKAEEIKQKREIAMSEFIVHSVPGSPFGRAVFAALEEKGASYGLAPVEPGSLRSPEHLARHPFGRVPVLEHDGFLLYETQAILRYLDRVLPKPALTPADPRRASRMDQVMNVNDWYLYQGVGTVIVFHRVIGPRLMGLTPDEAAIAAAMPKALAVFNELAHLLGEQRYFAEDAISLADLLVAPAVELFTATPEWSVLGAPHANLESWLARMQARPSMQATTWERVSELARAA